MKNKDIATSLGIAEGTFYNWEKSRPELFKIVKQHFEQEKKRPDFESKEFIKEEISKAIDRLPKQKAKKFYHLIMAELTEFE